ncbi:MAG: hypothetical protein AMXMBFR13_15050 [Phycisphaerae bacterium]
MKILAAIEADFEWGALGTRSRLADELGGETVLRRTLRRVLAARRVAGVHLVVEPRHESLARQMAVGLDVKVETHDGGAVPWREYVAAARKWSLDAWRGGLGGMTAFDECCNPWVLASLARREGADGVAAVPAGAVLLDPVLLDVMIEHFEKVANDVRLVFTQTTPGLSAAIYQTALLSDLAENRQPLGRVMAYRPSDPHRDMTVQPCFYPVASSVAHAVGRCVADTDTAMARLGAMIREASAGGAGPVSETAGDVLPCEQVSERLVGSLRDIDFLPDEVEIELTIEDSLPESTVRPRGRAVPARGPIGRELFTRIIDELADRDDARVVLGGYGDPLLHPEWREYVAHCRRAGMLGLAVRTPGVHLDDAAVATLIEHRVDVLNVLIDATTRETYQRLHGADLFDRVQENIQRVITAQQAARQPVPLLVCEMAKTLDTMDEMERFYDGWIERGATPVLIGPSSHAGRWPDLAVMRMSPPTRLPCGRLFRRAFVLADGRLAVCDQDYRGEATVGSLAVDTLGSLWQGERMQAIRGSHLAGRYDAMALCPTCDEWHRP